VILWWHVAGANNCVLPPARIVGLTRTNLLAPPSQPNHPCSYYDDGGRAMAAGRRRHGGRATDGHHGDMVTVTDDSHCTSVPGTSVPHTGKGDTRGIQHADGMWQVGNARGSTPRCQMKNNRVDGYYVMCVAISRRLCTVFIFAVGAHSLGGLRPHTLCPASGPQGPVPGPAVPALSYHGSSRCDNCNSVVAVAAVRIGCTSGKQ